jgi:hypothetical protein
MRILGFVNDVWDAGLLERRQKSIIVPLYNGGNIKDCENAGRINLLISSYKFKSKAGPVLN